LKGAFRLRANDVGKQLAESTPRAIVRSLLGGYPRRFCFPPPG
jgi:hypothetical protein